MCALRLHYGSLAAECAGWELSFSKGRASEPRSTPSKQPSATMAKGLMAHCGRNTGMVWYDPLQLMSESYENEQQDGKMEKAAFL